MEKDKVFRFLDLPRELRDLCYDYLKESRECATTNDSDSDSESDSDVSLMDGTPDILLPVSHQSATSENTLTPYNSLY